ncbi:MAG: sigma-70 family RNA polymerase sigma factor [Gemmataceae bacterium]
MPTSPTTRVIDRLRRSELLRDGAGPSDGELLGRFIERHDEVALAALVGRHGPMVWGVCRRLLNRHDAEDAFQATFLVLVRKATSIKPRGLIGNWLYGVAHRAALQVRRTTARRRTREVQVTVMPDPQTMQPDRRADVQPLLDQELSRLPDRYRSVIVLADLEGRTRKEVARHLGVPEGTVAGRLARARAMLAKRLAARGVALSGAAVAVVLEETGASAGVPVSVMTSTIRSASAFAVVPTTAAVAVSPQVAAVTQGVLKTMLLIKLRAVVAVTLIAGLLSVGAMALSGRTALAWSNQPPAAEQPALMAQQPNHAKEAVTAWGKEVGGLQAGLTRKGSGTYRPGESVELEVKLRNVGKAEVKVAYGLLRECPPRITDPEEERVQAIMPVTKMYKVRVTEFVVKPGDTVSLFRPEVALAERLRGQTGPEPDVSMPTVRVGPGKYKIAFDNMVQSHPALATGDVEFEVQEPAKPEAAPQESVTAWGKEVGGLQAGLGFRPGEKRAFSHDETVTLVLRIRNVSKQEVKFSYLQPFIEHAPIVIDGDGKSVPQPDKLYEIGERLPAQVALALGKEFELHELKRELKPASESGSNRPRPEGRPHALFGTGTVSVQYEQVLGSPLVGHPRWKLDPTLGRLATGKLQLEVRPEPTGGTGEPSSADRPDRKQVEKVIAEIKEMGGSVVVDATLPGTPVVEVELGNTRVGDGWLARLGALPDLQRLYLHNTPVTDAGLAHLTCLPKLRGLTLASTAVSDAGLAHVKKLTRLQNLSLKGSRVTDGGLVHLKGVTGLKSLDMGFTKVTDGGLIQLKELTGLRELDLGPTRVTDAGLVHLAGLTELRQLSLGGTRVTDAGLVHLERLSKLEGLNLSGTEVTDAGLLHLNHLTGLEWLSLGDTKVTDAGLVHLKGLLKLKALSLGGAKTTSGGIAGLRKALPALSIVR